MLDTLIDQMKNLDQILTVLFFFLAHRALKQLKISCKTRKTFPKPTKCFHIQNTYAQIYT